MSEAKVFYHLFTMANSIGRQKEAVEFIAKSILAKKTLEPGDAELFKALTKDEINILRNNYKDVTYKETLSDSEQNALLHEELKKYRQKIEDEFITRCDEYIKTVENDFLPLCAKSYCKVLCMNLLGDFYRYMGEIIDFDRAEKVNSQADEYYVKGLECAKELPANHPLRLGLVLNLSVLYHDHIGKPEKALELVHKTLEEAEQCDDMDQEESQDGITTIQMLKDNLKTWQADPEGSICSFNPYPDKKDEDGEDEDDDEDEDEEEDEESEGTTAML